MRAVCDAGAIRSTISVAHQRPLRGSVEGRALAVSSRFFNGRRTVTQRWSFPSGCS